MTDYGETTTGFRGKTFDETGADIRARMRALIDQNLTLDDKDPLGNIVDVFSDELALAWEALEVARNQFDPDNAEGQGAVALAVGELAEAEWDSLLSGSGSVHWRTPAPGFDVAAATLRLRAETMMSGAHGADTPVWHVFAQTPWDAVAGRSSRVRLVSWVADDWTEQDGQPAADSNGRVIVRALAFAGDAEAWAEAVCGRAGGRVRVEHIRVW